MAKRSSMAQNSEALVAEFEAFSVSVFQHLSFSKELVTLGDSFDFNNGFRHLTDRFKFNHRFHGLTRMGKKKNYGSYSLREWSGIFVKPRASELFFIA